ncbi:MAG: tetratricopeptide repeat protein [Candidatus Odinarchaeota archaeon]|nr:tetratricopeptide repeat protein [Candidatus Odinarchaeota archaeon]
MKKFLITFQDVSQHFGKNPKFWLYLGKTYMSLGKYDGTENALTKALTLKKDFDRTLMMQKRS